MSWCGPSPHGDERGSEPYNLELGEKRAGAVARYLAREGVEADRISASSRGKSTPLAQGRGMRAWATNRRVDFRVLGPEAELDLRHGALVDDRGRLLRAGH
jgi:peptidoglycan-associated lipoprotein